VTHIPTIKALTNSKNLVKIARSRPLRKNYVRLVDSDGDIEDVYRDYLEGALEARDTPWLVFYGNREWQEFLKNILEDTPDCTRI
jgi:hypothetical protein